MKIQNICIPWVLNYQNTDNYAEICIFALMKHTCSREKDKGKSGMRIIINADDFGISENVNQTILKLHRQGIVSSATIIANSNCFESAVEISKSNPDLDIGAHLCLDGPFNIGSGYHTLMDNTTGQFYPKNEVIKKIKKFALDESEIFREYCLQIEKILNCGISVSHLDHHHHLHLYFPVLKMVVKVARKYNIAYIRPQILYLHSNKSHLNSLYRRIHHGYLNSKSSTIDGYFMPAIDPDSKFEENLSRLNELLSIKNRIIEIMLHPVNDNDPETRFFTHPEVVELLARQDITAYGSLPGRNRNQQESGTEFSGVK